MPSRRTDQLPSRQSKSGLSSGVKQSRNAAPSATPTPSSSTSLRIRFRTSNYTSLAASTPPPPTPPPQVSPAPALKRPADPAQPAEPSWNEQERALINAGYQPAFEPPAAPESTKKKKTVRFDMAEPRARAARQKGQLNFGPELRLLLQAYGDANPHPDFPSEPLPETVRVLDEIVTDYILELCHGAAQVAHHAGRQKVKVDDFSFALRRDPNKLGRVQELLRMERELKEARKAFDHQDDQVAKDAKKKGAAAAAGLDEDEGASVSGTAVSKKSKGKGKRAAAGGRGSEATEESVAKKRKTIG